MPNQLTCIALHTWNERTTALIRADGPITRRGTPSITVKFPAAASRPVMVEATVRAASRTIPFIGATERFLALESNLEPHSTTGDRHQEQGEPD